MSVGKDTELGTFLHDSIRAEPAAIRILRIA